MELIETRKGAACLLVGGYRFRKSKTSKKRISWRCCNTHGCTARCITDSAVTNILSSSAVHNHEPDTEAEINRDRARMAVKRKAVDSLNYETAGRIACKEAARFPTMSSGNVDFLKSAVIRARRKQRSMMLPKCRDCLFETFDESSAEDINVHHDSNTDHRKIMMASTDKDTHHLVNNTHSLVCSNAGTGVKGNSQECITVEGAKKEECSPIHGTQVPDSDSRGEQRNIPSSSEEHRLMPSVVASPESLHRLETLSTAEALVPLKENLHKHERAVNKILYETAERSDFPHPLLPQARACPDSATSRMFDALHSYLLRRAYNSLTVEGLSSTELAEPACAHHRNSANDSDSASLSCEHDHSGKIAELIQKYKHALNVIDLLSVSLEREQNKSSELAFQVNHLSSVIKYMLQQGFSSPNSASHRTAETDANHSGETSTRETDSSEKSEDIKPNIYT